MARVVAPPGAKTGHNAPPQLIREEAVARRVRTRYEENGG
jgi:hypothetical protein